MEQGILGLAAFPKPTLMGAISTLVALPAGIAGAIGVAAGPPRSRQGVVETVVALPLVLPATAIGYLLLALLARDGGSAPAPASISTSCSRGAPR